MLIYRGNVLQFASAAAYSLLGESTENVRRVQLLLDKGQQTTLEVSTIRIGAEHRANLVQDCANYDELQKERAANKYLKDFFAMITHELRNTLNGLLGIFAGLEEHIGASSPEAAQCQTGVNTIKLAMRLVNDILDLSQLEANSFRLVDEPACVEDTVKECVSLMQFKFRTKGVVLRYERVGSVPTVCCDRNRYMQVLLNLIGNANKFTDSGEVLVSFRYDQSSSKLITSVKDTGVGIKESDAAMLFSFFGKLEDASHRNPQGVGLGLFVCKQLTLAMGGSIELDVHCRSGTRITFSILDKRRIDSVAPGPTTAPLSTREIEMTHGPAEKIALVVDDEVLCVDAVHAYLRFCGYDADKAK